MRMARWYSVPHAEACPAQRNFEPVPEKILAEWDRHVQNYYEGESQ